MELDLASTANASPAVAAVARLRPRVWTVFCASALAFVTAAMCTAVAVGVVMFVRGARSEMDSTAMMQRLGESFSGVALVLVPAQVPLLVGAVTPALLSRERWTERLALRRPAIGAASIVALLVGMLGVLGLVELLTPLLGEPSDNLRELTLLLTSSSGVSAAAIALLASLLPGLCEELLFRGYAQTRLVARFGAPIGIAIASTMFALSHVDPQHVVGVFPIAIWLGVVAWLARSTWVSAAAHALNNLVGIGSMQLLSDDGALEPEPAALACVAILCAIGALGVVLARRDRARVAASVC